MNQLFSVYAFSWYWRLATAIVSLQSIEIYTYIMQKKKKKYKHSSSVNCKNNKWISPSNGKTLNTLKEFSTKMLNNISYFSI